MKTMTKSGLIHFLKKEEIAYQFADGLLSFSSSEKEPLISRLQESTSFSLVQREEMLDTCYSELAEWSIADDYLFLSDNGILICLSDLMMRSYSAA